MNDHPTSALRLFDPDNRKPETNEVSAAWPLQTFFTRWYKPQLAGSRRRKPVKASTIERRYFAVRWWSRLMAEPGKPLGPSLRDIDEDMLELFSQRLEAATYRRGPRAMPRKLGAITRQRHLEELFIVLNACGPRSGTRPRATILADPPSIYVDEVPIWPKATWTIDEAKKLATSTETIQPPRRWPLTDQQYRSLAQATIALWFYTGHRARSYEHIRHSDLVESAPGQWF